MQAKLRSNFESTKEKGRKRGQASLRGLPLICCRKWKVLMQECKIARMQDCVGLHVSRGAVAVCLCPAILSGLLNPAVLHPAADDGIEGAVGVFGALERLDILHDEGLGQLLEDVLVAAVALAAGGGLLVLAHQRRTKVLHLHVKRVFGHQTGEVTVPPYPHAHAVSAAQTPWRFPRRSGVPRRWRHGVVGFQLQQQARPQGQLP